MLLWDFAVSDQIMLNHENILSPTHIHVWNKARQAGKMDLDESLNLDLFSLVHIFTILSRFLYKLENVNTVWAEFFCFSDMAWMKLKKKKSSGTKTRCQMLKVPELETQKD